MPGAPELIDVMAFSNDDNLLMMRSTASLYSSQGLLSGMLTLYRNRLLWSEVSSRSSNMLTISMDVMFGATLSPPGKFKFKSFETASATNLSIESSTHFTVYTIMAHEGGKRPLCDTWSFKVESEEESAMWVELLHCAIRPKLAEEDINVLVFLNPVSGKRKATKVFETIVKPIFDIGCTPYTLKVTESPGFATEFAEKEDLSSFSSVVVVSGDGLLHEVLNGLLRRTDWPKYKSLPLGVIPAGTGNGLAKSLDIIWPEQAAVAVVKADVRALDIMSATLASGLTKYCFLSMTWGLLADIDIESETMRWAGSARLDLYGTVRLMNLRYYGGRLHYLPAVDSEDNEFGAAQRQDAGGFVQPSSNNSSILNMLDRTNQGLDDAWGLPPPSFSSPLVRHSPKLMQNYLTPNIQPAVTLHPTLTAGIQLPITEGSLPPRWKTIEGPFVQVIATNVPWLSTDFLACQNARISDSTIDLVYSRNVSKWQIMPYMASSTKDNYMNKDGVENIKARAFILEPTGLRTTSRSESSHREIQNLDQPAAKDTNSSNTSNDKGSSTMRPLSVPGFNSLRIKTIGKVIGRSTRSSSLQAPVPARVRSEVYSSYHQQTAGRTGGLLAQGLTPPPMAPDSLSDNQFRRDTESPVEISVSPKMVGDNKAVPRPPAQAAFSLRSETELASMAIMDVATPSATAGGNKLNITHSTVPGASQVTTANGRAAEAPAEYPAGGCKLVGNHGIVDLDGEAVELGPIKIECLANLVSIISPPWLDESQAAKVGTLPKTKAFEPIKGSLSREGSVLSFTNI
ncbi:hypothetical protein LPJ66_003557 [Kickxella alabastrina]|uniref:Uncharacterized protein n=1 Tax=Kickxella alabastrina TaxID=61397 RepID=A0ACC1IJS9_9FUNG|nr:hypothetical protein LPJ66_003557 [Kickxella alabastrina]